MFGATRESRGRDRGQDRDRCDEADEAPDVADEPPRGDPRADDESDEGERFGDGGGDASTPFVEAELLVVEQRGERDETDQRGGEEGEAPPDPLKRLHLVGSTPALGERGRLLLGVDDFLRRAGGMSLPSAPGRFAQPCGHDGEDDGRDHEDQERNPPVEVVGEQTGAQRADERADGIGRAMEAVHPRPRLDGVVVGDQRVVRRVDHGFAE